MRDFLRQGRGVAAADDHGDSLALEMGGECTGAGDGRGVGGDADEVGTETGQVSGILAGILIHDPYAPIGRREGGDVGQAKGRQEAVAVPTALASPVELLDGVYEQ